jgi:hypothetical protein
MPASLSSVTGSSISLHASSTSPSAGHHSRTIRRTSAIFVPRKRASPFM